ncbi:hypothetical protein J1N35_021018 [Gossypium stocksii]|uniref:Leucine-rich repeat-containing N-terminal plant-type domain-containing protein n=1 Tax=Gossypium stocksii TaxID=47602 RepID=A0A9D3VEX7_9ROSI|nr:hypothetical protein J1N35_021018 [Gossypium stocksii]
MPRHFIACFCTDKFKRSIPRTIGELNSLSDTLNLSYNHLSNNLPESLGNLLVTVYLSYNLSRKIPKRDRLLIKDQPHF